MAKKQTIKNNDPSINFRLSNKLKGIIESKAQEKNITTSAYVRDLLERVHNGDYCHSEQVKETINSFLFSKEFMQLMIWIYSKQKNREMTEDAAKLDSYLKTLKRVDGHLPDNLVKEFDKVLNDILMVRASNSIYSKKFEFLNTSDNAKRFNLELIESFLLNDWTLDKFLRVSGNGLIEVPKISSSLFEKLSKDSE
ncbi:MULTISPECIES: hypothetical protein [Bizionia]|uniref:Uncharacterized protein n=1 Tax=Bizionia algoritergicola TaxID=291187 RepID=A0A5D0R4Y3_9FLAO|nr:MULTISPECIES: hypothetical protein [Bizionia]OBX20143.1 hypothetical protein BAA08_14740 [Bizionia sp. APA-3]TYB75654.1 hypothetical protein ES675_05915 [Bizionia algoritergicola]